jgi:drug/metabolite transporter (DMT)-like permease
MKEKRSVRAGAGFLVYAELIAGMVIFGSGTPVSKVVTKAFPVFIASGLRMAVASLALLPFILLNRGRLSRLSKGDYLLVALIALVGMFGFSAFMLYGMKMVSGVAGSVVMSATPAVTALASFVFLKEHLGWRKALAVALAVAGVLVVNTSGAAGGESGAGGATLGSLLIFAAVCSEAAYTLLGKKASDDADPLLIAGLASLLALPLFLPFAIYEWSGFDASKPAWTDWLAVLWWGAGTLALGTVLWYRGVSEVEGSIAAGFMGVMPVSALVLSYVLLGEPFRWVHLLGFALVFAGVLLIASAHARMSR